MPSSAPRLLIIDQSLKNFEGHYFEYDLAVIEAAEGLGIQTALAPHQGFAANALGSAPVVGRFSEDWNAAGRSPIRAALRRGLASLPTQLRHPLLKAATSVVSRNKPSAVTANRRFAQRVLEIVVDTKLDANDHVLIHTLGESELLGLATVLSDSGAPLPHLHVVLRYDGSPAAAEAFAILGDVSKQLKFWTDTDQLAKHYRKLGALSIDVLPIPHCLHGPLSKPNRDSEQLIISYLGGARGDKGFNLLPGLAEAIAPMLQAGRARLRVQCNYALSTEEPTIAEACKSLAKFPSDWVEMIDRPLDINSFQTALLTTDLLLLPYRQDIYRRRSSGLLVQAMVAGIPTVVPANTWLAAKAPIGAHVTFDGDSSLVNAVYEAAKRHADLLTEAQRAIPEARRRYDARRLVQAVLESAPANIQFA